MSRKIIDLTLEIKNNMTTQDVFQSNIYMPLVSHEDSLEYGSGVPEDPFTSAWNYIGMIEHIGTHVDAYYHMDPNGLTVDKMPLDLFFGKAVCFDMSHIPERGKVTVADVEEAERKTGIKVNGHIVLFATGIHRKYYPNKEILTRNPEITAGVVEWLAARHSRMHGVEGASTDIMDINLFPNHRKCRDLGISHFEWLVNLEKLVGKGEFMFYGVPLKLSNGTGSPVRAFAILDEQTE